MGRYAGEEYAPQPRCRPGEHRWAMNGTCWKCNHWRDGLLAEARRIIELEEQGRFGETQP